MPTTVVSGLRHEGDPIKGSRFIASVATVGSEPAAKEFLEEVRAEMPDAGHHCWAWRFAAPVIERAGDDGEPSGSAGRPILAQLTGRDLVCAAVVVSRYWGGTKLGVGGLVRAYGGAARDALDLCVVEPWMATTSIEVVHGYPAIDAIERAIAEAGGTSDDIDFGVKVRRTVVVPVSVVPMLCTALRDATGGAVTIIAANAEHQTGL